MKAMEAILKRGSWLKDRNALGVTYHSLIYSFVFRKALLRELKQVLSHDLSVLDAPTHIPLS